MYFLNMMWIEMDPLKPRLPQPPSPGLSSAKKEMNPKPNQVSDFFFKFCRPFCGYIWYNKFQVGTIVLYGIPIVSLVIENQERLCLAQISNTLLKQFSYNEIHNRRVALGKLFSLHLNLFKNIFNSKLT